MSEPTQDLINETLVVEIDRELHEAVVLAAETVGVTPECFMLLAALVSAEAVLDTALVGAKIAEQVEELQSAP